MSDYEIGYGKPPKHAQFKPGHSGNRKGRPKDARGLKTDLREEMSERVSITENGKTHKVSKQRLILKAMATKAAKGDVRAAQQLVSLLIQAFGLEDERTGKAKLSANDQALFDEMMDDVRSADEEPAPEASGNGAGNRNNHGGDVISPEEEESSDE